MKRRDPKRLAAVLMFGTEPHNEGYAMEILLTELTETLFEKMVGSSEVWALADLVDDIARFEAERGCQFKLTEISLAWLAAADRLIDSLIQNEYETESSEAVDTRIERWERHRPTTKRRNELAERFKGF